LGHVGGIIPGESSASGVAPCAAGGSPWQAPMLRQPSAGRSKVGANVDAKILHAQVAAIDSLVEFAQRMSEIDYDNWITKTEWLEAGDCRQLYLKEFMRLDGAVKALADETNLLPLLPRGVGYYGITALEIDGDGKPELENWHYRMAEYRGRVGARAELALHQSPTNIAGHGLPPDLSSALPDDAMMNHVDIAKTLGIKREPLRKRLERWRKVNMDGWQQVTEPRRSEPRYVYRIGAIRHLLND
jgi:hypothetical protein